MNKRSLGVVAVVLIVLMAIVATAGLDRLPRNVRSSIAAARTQMSSDRAQFNEARAAVNRAIGNEPALFRTQAALWQSRLLQADERLKQAEASAAKLKKIEDANRKEDRQAAEAELRNVGSLRAGAVEEAKNLSSEANRWIGYKRNLPAMLSRMKADYESVHSLDPRAQATAAQKAIVDWPAKKDDIEKRLTTLDGLKKQAEEAWTASASSREAASKGAGETVDYPALFAAGEAISEDLREIQRGVTNVNTLASQLYVGRDKVLLELDDDEGERQKVRVVETKVADSTMASPQTASREEWERVDQNRFAQLKKSVGMVVERKPVGRFDSETDRNIQPPGYAYIAPPGQSNSYGSWNNGTWSWLPQYLILSQLLRGPSWGSIGSGDYYDYDRARRRGDVWYGRNGEYGSTWSRGTSGGLRGTLDRLRTWGSGTSSQGGGTISGGTTRPRDTWNTGGSTYGGSRYQSRGTYGGSRYQSAPRSGGGFGYRGYSRGGGSFSRGFGGGGRR